MKRLSTLQIWILSVAVFVGFGVIGTLEQQDRIAAEEHAKHSMQLAQRDENERKAEFDYLAKKATYMTGFAAVSKK